MKLTGMKQFRQEQRIRVIKGGLSGKSGIVRLVETDGSAWVAMHGGEKLLAKLNGEYKVKGKCVLLWPEDCQVQA